MITMCSVSGVVGKPETVKKSTQASLYRLFCDGEVKVMRKRQVLLCPNQEGDVRKMLR